MVGKPLARSLLDEGWEVVGVARFRDELTRNTLEAADVTCIPFDVLSDNPDSLPDVDVLFLEIWDAQAQASGGAEFIWSMNYHAVGRVVERYAGVADIVNGSTINVYGDGPDTPTEDAPSRPTSEYGISRFAQEKLIDYFCVRSSGRRGIHVRYAHANTATRGVIRRLAEDIMQEKSLGSDPDRRIQVISLEDFVRVTRAAVDRASCPPCAVNCCHPVAWTKRELAERIRKALGRGKVIFEREHGGAEASATADPRRMCEWFGEPTISVDDMINRAVQML